MLNTKQQQQKNERPRLLLKTYKENDNFIGLRQNDYNDTMTTTRKDEDNYYRQTNYNDTFTTCL